MAGMLVKEVGMKCKMIHLVLGLVLALLLSVPVSINASVSDDGYKKCEHAIKKWASSSTGSEDKDDKHALLFFLHVPRTGGRSYLHWFLILPNLTSVARTTKLLRRKSSGTSTLDIWPWKYLVPWMREDLFAQRDNRKLRGQSHLGTNNSYAVADVAMPLQNGFSPTRILRFQVSQTTLITPKHMMCVIAYSSTNPSVNMCSSCKGIGEKKKLDDMLYVGLTENHKESATMFANIVGAQVISQHTLSSSSKDVPAENDSELDSSLSDTKSDANDRDNNTNHTLENVSSTNKDKELTVGKLTEAYETCISNLRNTRAERRANSLKRISPANFTKEARLQVPEDLIKEIESLNKLDVELYNYAQGIFTKQQTHTLHGMVHAETLSSTVSSSTYPSFYNSPYWKLLTLSITGLLLLLFVFIFVNSRRTSKVQL